MQHQLKHYLHLLVAEQSALAGRIAISAQNDTVSSLGPCDLSVLTNQILHRLDCAAVIVAEPLQPFVFFLLRRSIPDKTSLVPRDSESLSSLHDIPLIRRQSSQTELLNEICAALHKRKGCIVDGIGIVSQASLTVEQAYITWTSLLHASTIKYFDDLLSVGPLLHEEKNLIRNYNLYFKPLTMQKLMFHTTHSTQPQSCVDQMCLAGKATVQMGLVDSFFGNVSCTADNILCISQTSARLDELAGQIDLVFFDGSSTAGITASSELPAHRALYLTTGCKAILHGHPRFAVIMSFFATPGKHAEIDMIDTIPVVRGDGGVGGLAESLSKAFQFTTERAAVVRGHGVFAISHQNFDEALAALTEVEQRCKTSYFALLNERHQI